MRYIDRADAGRRLAPEIAAVLADRGDGGIPLVLGIPRGGVVVGYEVAKALSGRLEVALARKIGAPNNPELAIGAIGEYGNPVIDRSLVDRLAVPAEFVDAQLEIETRELERRASAYRGSRPAPDVSGRTVVVVDDGIATGATLQAVLVGIRGEGPGSLICAAPVGAPDSVARIAGYADVLVCPHTPRWFRAVGEWYESFDQTTDDEVLRILELERGSTDR